MEANEEEDNLDHLFVNENEKIFYEHGKDVDFIKYHKRATKNFRVTI